MEIFLDSANRKEVTRLKNFPFVVGITTNPSLISQEKVKIEELINLTRKNNLKIFIQTLGKDREDIYKEGLKYFSLYPEGVVLKIPFSSEGLKVIPVLKKENIPIAITSIFSLSQIIVSLPLQPEYVIPYIDRIGRSGGDGIRIVREAKEIITREKLATKILSASFRSVKQVEEAVLAGSDAITIPMKVLKDIMLNPLSEKAIKDFKTDWLSMNEKEHI
ncbi:MAG: hypothetical protein DRI28_03130 [Caldiserica bacterium]|nr:MAG: hypothetical protein DRI28_03130 [Caldisericota bacterium]